MSDYFFPKLTAVAPLAPYRLRTTWSTGEVLEVNVGEILRKIPALAPILDPEVFARAHIAESGGGIEWFNAEFGEDNNAILYRDGVPLASREAGVIVPRAALEPGATVDAELTYQAPPRRPAPLPQVSLPL